MSPKFRRAVCAVGAAVVLGPAAAVLVGTNAIGQSTSTKPTVTYVANGQTVTGKVWDEDIGQIEVAPSTGGPVSVINRSDTVGTTTTPTDTTPAPPSSDPTLGRPYNDESPFNTPIPAGTATTSSSAATIAASGFPSNGLINSMRVSSSPSNDWSHPIYKASASDPSYTIRCNSGGVNGMSIHIPNGARPTGSQDGHMAILNTDGYEYDLWIARAPSGGTVTCDIGYRQPWRDSLTGVKALGIVLPADRQKDSSLGGGTASFFGEQAGLIRANEIAAGVIPHALFIVVPCQGTGGGWVYPASHNGSFCPGNANAPRMGQRFQLRMTDEQIAASCAPGWEKTVATALAHYGGYMGDTGGGGFGPLMESSLTYTAIGQSDPWAAVASQYGIKKDASYGYMFKPSGCIKYQQNTVAVTPPAAIG